MSLTVAELRWFLKMARRYAEPVAKDSEVLHRAAGLADAAVPILRAIGDANERPFGMSWVALSELCEQANSCFESEIGRHIEDARTQLSLAIAKHVDVLLLPGDGRYDP